MKSTFIALATLPFFVVAAQAQSTGPTAVTQNQAAPVIQERTLGPKTASTTGAGTTGSAASVQGTCHEITVRSQDSQSVTTIRNMYRCD